MSRVADVTMRSVPALAAISSAPSSSAPSIAPREFFLQRECDCGSGGSGDDCAECEAAKADESVVQPKLEISEPGDPYEQEADRIADQVMRDADSASVGPAPARIQRAAEAGTARTSTPSLKEVLQSPGQPLDRDTRTLMKTHLNHDFGSVRVHTDRSAHASAKAFGALAYTVGNHVVFAHERYRPAEGSGRRLLAHELVHVVQQGGAGRSLQPIEPSGVNQTASTTDEMDRLQKARNSPVSNHHFHSKYAGTTLDPAGGLSLHFSNGQIGKYDLADPDESGQMRPYRPQGPEVGRLLARGLTHVVQQTGNGASLQRQSEEGNESVDSEPTADVGLPESEKDPGTGGTETIESSTEDEEASDPKTGQDDRDLDQSPVQAKSVGGEPSGFKALPAKSSGRALPGPVRNKMEAMLGFNLSAVRLHSDAAADRFVAGGNAYAATSGTDIYSRSNLSLESQPWLLAHELAHVVQQGRSTSSAVRTHQFKSTAKKVSDDQGLEKQADQVADDVAAGKPTRVDAGVVPAPRVLWKKICQHDSTQFADYPQTYISAVTVDLTSPAQNVTLAWSGPNAARGDTGPFHSSPGAGLCGTDCDNRETSRRGGSRCTPKGTFKISGYSCQMSAYPEAKNVSWFSRSGIALHFYPSLPNYPASHGCVRLGAEASRLVYDNSIRNTTDVTVGGTFARGNRGFCWP